MTIEQDEVPSVQEAMDGDYMKVVFQPILDLSQHKPFGYECLVRCKFPGLENPLRLFELDAAHAEDEAEPAERTPHS